MESEDDNKNLYRFEYYSEEDEATYVDWVWLKPDEVSEYKSDIASVSIRKASSEEEELYNEAYADGYGIAAVLEFSSQYDGITFRVNRGEDDTLDMLNTTKMFECATCGNHKDFETEVATANDFYLGLIKDDKLWHVCFDCATLQMEIESIEVDLTEEGKADS